MTLNINSLLKQLEAGEIQAAIGQLKAYDGVVFFGGVTAEDIIYERVDELDDLTDEQMAELIVLAEAEIEAIAESMGEIFMDGDYGEFGLLLSNAVSDSGFENPFYKNVDDEGDDELSE